MGLLPLPRSKIAEHKHMHIIGQVDGIVLLYLYAWELAGRSSFLLLELPEARITTSRANLSNKHNIKNKSVRFWCYLLFKKKVLRNSSTLSCNKRNKQQWKKEKRKIRGLVAIDYRCGDEKKNSQVEMTSWYHCVAGDSTIPKMPVINHLQALVHLQTQKNYPAWIVNPQPQLLRICLIL